MRDVHRHRLELEPRQKIVMPVGSQILSVQTRHDRFLDLWYEFSAGAAGSRTVEIAVVGTGTADVPEEPQFRYFATVQMHGGSLVFHIYVGDVAWMPPRD